MMKNLRKLYRSEGFSLIELGIILGIVGLVVGAVWIAASSVHRNMRKSQLANDVLQIAQNTQALFITQGNAGADGADTNLFIQTGVIPPNLINRQSGNNSKAFNAFDKTPGSTTVTADPNATTFVITMTGIPKEACISLLSDRLAPNKETVDKIKLVKADGGTEITDYADGITPAEADAGCSNDPTIVKMTFKFY